MTPAANLALRVAQRVGDKLVQQLDRTFQKSDGPLDDDALRSLNDFGLKLATEDLNQAHPDDLVTVELDKNGQPGQDNAWLVHFSGVESQRRGLPEFSITITRFEKGAATACAIYSPMRQEEFTAARGKGVSYGGRRVRGSGVTVAQGASAAVVGTNTPDFIAGTVGTGDVMRDVALASTARIDLAIALDLDYEVKAPLHLMLTEAGHLVGDRNGGPISSTTTDLVAAPAKAFKLLIPALRKHLAEEK